MHLPKSPWLRWGLGLALGLLLFVGIGSQFRSEAQLPTLSPLPQDPYIQAYFNQSQASVYTDPYRRITRYGDDLEQVMIEAIQSAQSSIEVAVQEFTLPNLAIALGQRRDAGVRVRVVLENSYSTPIAQKTQGRSPASTPTIKPKPPTSTALLTKIRMAPSAPRKLPSGMPSPSSTRPRCLA